MENETCSICREDHSDFETRCGHFFHENCLQAWFERNNGVNLSCPACRCTLTNSKDFEKILRRFALSDFKYEDMTGRDILPVIETLICEKGFPSQEFFEKLFELGWNGNTPIFGSNYAVHSIAQTGRVDLLGYICRSGANINIMAAGFTPLHLACLKGDFEMVEKLIELGADINIVSETSRFDIQFEDESENYYLGKNETALHLAIFNEHIELIKLLIEKGADANVRDGDGVTQLLKAMRGNFDFELIELFIKHGADITVADQEGVNSVHLACMKSDSRFFEYFITFAPNLTTRTCNGSTALHYAAQRGNILAVKTLLDHGIDQTVVNDRLDTPLLLAMNGKHYEVIRLFVENCSESMKTSPVIRLACGNLIAHSIKQIVTDSNCDSLKRHFEYIKFLFDKFNDISIAVEHQQQFFKTILVNKVLLDKVLKLLRPSLQDTILIAICESNNYELFMEYLGRNYNINSLNYLEENALFYATDSRIIRELIYRGINVNQKNKNGITSFMRACQIGNDTLFDSLLDICDIHAVCIRGKNALFYALKSLNTNNIKRLIGKGINVNKRDSLGLSPADCLIFDYLIMKKRVEEGKVIEIIRLLKSAGAEFSYKNIFKSNLTEEGFASFMNQVL